MNPLLVYMYRLHRIGNLESPLEGCRDNSKATVQIQTMNFACLQLFLKTLRDILKTMYDSWFHDGIY